jgi:hypothetical protein
MMHPTTEPVDILVRAKLIEQFPGDCCVCIEVGTMNVTQQFWARRDAVIFDIEKTTPPE